MKKKIIAIILIIMIFSPLYYFKYQETHNHLTSILYIPLVIILSGIGAGIGSYIMNAFKSNENE